MSSSQTSSHLTELGQFPSQEISAPGPKSDPHNQPILSGKQAPPTFSSKKISPLK